MITKLYGVVVSHYKLYYLIVFFILAKQLFGAEATQDLLQTAAKSFDLF